MQRAIFFTLQSIEYIRETFGLEPLEAMAKPDRQLWLPLANRGEDASVAMTPATEQWCRPPIVPTSWVVLTLSTRRSRKQIRYNGENRLRVGLS
jgi:hypothetical protein